MNHCYQFKSTTINQLISISSIINHGPQPWEKWKLLEAPHFDNDNFADNFLEGTSGHLEVLARFSVAVWMQVAL